MIEKLGMAVNHLMCNYISNIFSSLSRFFSRERPALSLNLFKVRSGALRRAVYISSPMLSVTYPFPVDKYCIWQFNTPL